MLVNGYKILHDPYMKSGKFIKIPEAKSILVETSDYCNCLLHDSGGYYFAMFELMGINDITL